MKLAAAVLVFAMLCLLAGSLAWLRTPPAPPGAPDAAAADAALVAFDGEVAPSVVVDITARYAGRRDLLDPRLALPAWHRFVREQAVAVHVATQACPPRELGAVFEPSLAKAYAWHRQTCDPASAVPDGELLDGPPFVHPSGRSYAALALARGVGDDAATVAWARAHARSFHVVELAALGPAVIDALEPSDRALASLASSAWEGLVRGDRVVLTRDSLVVAEHGPLGLASLRFHPRAAWESFSRTRALVLTARERTAPCVHPASSALCWETRPAVDGHRSLLVAWTAGSALLVVAASMVVAVAYVGERRRMHADRIHVLRTLTHELRTPATSLRIDIEPLRAAYDELPAGCQEPLLRISDGIERLQRVLHRSARYMTLFENGGATREQLVNLREVPSARAMFEELEGEWPEGVVTSAPREDAAVTTDPEWLGVAVRNLVENGTRHGAAPVSVTWSVEGGDLVVRVADAGRTVGFSLRRAVAPHARDERSPGLGLGLAIVDRVARLLGGSLAHEPSPTTFELRVPARGGPT